MKWSGRGQISNLDGGISQEALVSTIDMRGPEWQQLDQACEHQVELAEVGGGAGFLTAA